MEAMGGKQLPPEVWQRYLDGTDIATYGLPQNEALLDRPVIDPTPKGGGLSLARRPQASPRQ